MIDDHNKQTVLSLFNSTRDLRELLHDNVTFNLKAIDSSLSSCVNDPRDLEEFSKYSEQIDSQYLKSSKPSARNSDPAAILRVNNTMKSQVVKHRLVSGLPAGVINVPLSQVPDLAPSVMKSDASKTEWVTNCHISDITKPILNIQEDKKDGELSTEIQNFGSPSPKAKRVFKEIQDKDDPYEDLGKNDNALYVVPQLLDKSLNDSLRDIVKSKTV